MTGEEEEYEDSLKGPFKWEPDHFVPDTRRLGETWNDVEERERWERSHIKGDDDGFSRPLYHSPDCPRKWNPDQRCNCGLG